MAQFTILSTRKIASFLNEEAKAKGIEIMEQEFIEVRPVEEAQLYHEMERWGTYPGKIAVVFTSQHAYKSIERLLRPAPFRGATVGTTWQIFCLSGATRNTIIEGGYLDEAQIVATADNGAALAEKILAYGPFDEVVFFCGNIRREVIPAALKKQGVPLHEVVVYETTETPAIATGHFDAVLFFSPSAVRSFFSVNSIPKSTACFAIGPTTAEAIAGFTDNRTITCEKPYEQVMIASVCFYLQNREQYQ